MTARAIQLVYFKSDTTGEKAYEEFFVPGEKIAMDRFSALGVVEKSEHRQMVEIDGFFNELEDIRQTRLHQKRGRGRHKAVYPQL